MSYPEGSSTPIWVAQISSLTFCNSQLLSVCAYILKYKYRSVLGSVELTSVLLLSHRLTNTALLSSGCKATV